MINCKNLRIDKRDNKLEIHQKQGREKNDIRCRQFL